MLNKCDIQHNGILTVCLTEQSSVLHNRIIQFAEEDVYRYFITDDEFNLRVYFGDFEFSISSNLYWLLESQFNVNFHKAVYACEII